MFFLVAVHLLSRSHTRVDPGIREGYLGRRGDPDGKETELDGWSLDSGLLEKEGNLGREESEVRKSATPSEVRGNKPE